MKKVMHTLLITTLSAGVALSMSGCSQTEKSVADMGYINVKNLPDTDNKVSPMRAQNLTESATTLGAQGALAWRSDHINEALDAESKQLDQLFDFNQLLLKHHVLPAVVSSNSNELNLADKNTIRFADKDYKIVSAARFVTTPPTWRNYLWMSYSKPDVPAKAVLPTTQAEAEIWNDAIKTGWKQGLTQANDIFASNVSRLKRDFTGMILYRKLLAQGMISSPIVAKSNMGITGDANQMRLNDQVMRITAKSALQLNQKSWQPVLTDQ